MLKNLSIIGLSLILGKIFFFALPYFVSANEYNDFNQVYYTASLVVSIAALGFNISFVEKSIKLGLLFTLVIINLIPVYVVIFLLDNTIDLPAVVISYTLILTGIFTFYFIFKGKPWKYLITNLVLFSSQIITIVIVKMFDLGIETAFMIMMTVALIITALLIKYNYQPIDSVDLKKFYQIGISAFIINGAAVIAFNADKFLINNFFSIDTANAYTFAWTLIAPSFYIGTLIEKGIYSEKAESRLIKKTKKYSILLLAALVLYFVALTFAVNLFPDLIPNSLQHSVLVDLLYIMIPGFLLFTLIHTPVNAVLFKLYKDKIRSKIALLFAPVIALFLITMFILTQIELNDNVLLILSITWLYLFILQGIKIYLMKTNVTADFMSAH